MTFFLKKLVIFWSILIFNMSGIWNCSTHLITLWINMYGMTIWRPKTTTSIQYIFYRSAFPTCHTHTHSHWINNSTQQFFSLLLYRHPHSTLTYISNRFHLANSSPILTRTLWMYVQHYYFCPECNIYSMHKRSPQILTMTGNFNDWQKPNRLWVPHRAHLNTGCFRTDR